MYRLGRVGFLGVVVVQGDGWLRCFTRSKKKTSEFSSFTSMDILSSHTYLSKYRKIIVDLPLRSTSVAESSGNVSLTPDRLPTKRTVFDSFGRASARRGRRSHAEERIHDPSTLFASGNDLSRRIPKRFTTATTSTRRSLVHIPARDIQHTLNPSLPSYVHRRSHRHV